MTIKNNSFWNQFSDLLTSGIVENGRHFKLQFSRSLKCFAAHKSFEINFNDVRPILLINTRVFSWVYCSTIESNRQFFTGNTSAIRFFKSKPYTIGRVLDIPFGTSDAYYWSKTRMNGIAIDIRLLYSIDNVRLRCNPRNQVTGIDLTE